MSFERLGRGEIFEMKFWGKDEEEISLKLPKISFENSSKSPHIPHPPEAADHLGSKKAVAKKCEA